MSVIRTGSNKKYADNWENIFGGKKSVTGKAKPAPAKAAKSTKKVAAAKAKPAKKGARKGK